MIRTKGNAKTITYLDDKLIGSFCARPTGHKIINAISRLKISQASPKLLGNFDAKVTISLCSVFTKLT